MKRESVNMNQPVILIAEPAMAMAPSLLRRRGPIAGLYLSALVLAGCAADRPLRTPDVGAAVRSEMQATPDARPVVVPARISDALAEPVGPAVPAVAEPRFDLLVNDAAGARRLPGHGGRHPLQHADAPRGRGHAVGHAARRHRARGAGVDPRCLRLRLPHRRPPHHGLSADAADPHLHRQLPARSAAGSSEVRVASAAPGQQLAAAAAHGQRRHGPGARSGAGGQHPTAATSPPARAPTSGPRPSRRAARAAGRRRRAAR